MYLINIDYRNDTERKRVEYLLQKWVDAANLTKPTGFTLLAEGPDVEEMIKELIAKTSKEQVNVYSIKKAEIGLETEKEEIEMTFDASKNSVKKFIDYMLAKRKAVLKHTGSGFEEYSIYTRKGGKATITVKMTGDGKTKLSLKVTGYKPATEYLYKELKEELNYFKGGE